MGTRVKGNFILWAIACALFLVCTPSLWADDPPAAFADVSPVHNKFTDYVEMPLRLSEYVDTSVRVVSGELVFEPSIFTAAWMDVQNEALPRAAYFWQGFFDKNDLRRVGTAHLIEPGRLRFTIQTRDGSSLIDNTNYATKEGTQTLATFTLQVNTTTVEESFVSYENICFADRSFNPISTANLAINSVKILLNQNAADLDWALYD